MWAKGGYERGAYWAILRGSSLRNSGLKGFSPKCAGLDPLDETAMNAAFKAAQKERDAFIRTQNKILKGAK